jgi:hypothetical protein
MIWTGVASIIAYLIGGYFASRIARVISRDNGALNGLMVFLISVPFMLLMGALSATGIVSGLGGLAGGIFSGGMQAVTSGVAPQQMGVQLTPQQITQATEAARNTAWAGLILGLICCAVSAIGGFFGAIPEDRVVQERVDVE